MLAPERWSARVERARALADRHSPAADILGFYAQLSSHQRELAARWVGAAWKPALVLEALPETLEWFEKSGPAALSRAVQPMRQLPVEGWEAALEHYLVEHEFDAADAPRTFVIETLLQPLAEQCASSTRTAHSGHDNRCPFCGQRPATGVLRDAGQGTRRALVCGLCFLEWPFERIACPSCGERKFDALPVYTAEQVAGVRVDGCDSCGVYLKTMDASKDGTIIPEVDDLATLTLDLWAREHGYRRLRRSFYL